METDFYYISNLQRSSEFSEPNLPPIFKKRQDILDNRVKILNKVIMHQIQPMQQQQLLKNISILNEQRFSRKNYILLTQKIWLLM